MRFTPIGRCASSPLALVFAVVGLAVPATARADDLFATGAIVNTIAYGEFDSQHYWGGAASVAGNLTRSFGVVAEASGEYRGDDYNNSFTYFTLVGGPRFGRTSGHARPFVQFPVGWARSQTIFRLGSHTDTYSDNYFVVQPGGGVDVSVTDRLAIRLGADYLVASPWYPEAWRFYNVRFVTGLTFKL
jgi:hypothetical protein